MPPPVAPRTRSRLSRQLIAVGIGVLLALVCMEVVLQIGSYLRWSSLQQPVRTLSSRRTVLCVGDSFTYGLGSSGPDASYPAVVDRGMETRHPGRWRVINRGVPGNDSARVLRRLGGLLASFRPARVYLLVGYNDQWQLEPEVVDVDSTGPTGFEWRIRTLELLRRIAIGVNGGPDVAAAPESAHPEQLLGVWHTDAGELLLEADGCAEMLGQPFRWRAVDSTLRIGRDRDSEQTVDWRIEDNRLSLTGAWLPGGRALLDRGPAPKSPRETVEAALDRGDLTAAAASLRDAPQGEPNWQLLRIQLAAAQGDTQALGIRLAEYESMVGTSRPARITATIAMLQGGDRNRGVANATALLEDDARAGELWLALATLAQREGADLLRSVAAMLDRSIEQVRDEPDWVWRLRSVRAAVLDHLPAHDAAAALADALFAGKREGVYHMAIRMTRREPRRYDPPVWKRAIDSLQPLADQEQANIERTRDTALGEANTAAAVFERHLHRCHELCQSVKSELVLLLYPEPTPFDHVVRRVARDASLRVLDPQPRFQEALRGGPRGRYFVLDGHCNDRGYELLGDCVLADLLEFPSGDH